MYGRHPLMDEKFFFMHNKVFILMPSFHPAEELRKALRSDEASGPRRKDPLTVASSSEKSSDIWSGETEEKSKRNMALPAPEATSGGKPPKEQRGSKSMLALLLKAYNECEVSVPDSVPSVVSGMTFPVEITVGFVHAAATIRIASSFQHVGFTVPSLFGPLSSC